MAETGTKPQIRRGRKFDQVLEGARTVFLRDGFEGASVDDIAREAGVSKATLYSYFPDKRLLFIEVAKTECARQADEAVQIIEAVSMPVEEVLRFAGGRFIDYMSSEFGLQTYRLCVAEADRFPQLGHAFYHSGPELVRARLVDYLRKAVDRESSRSRTSILRLTSSPNSARSTSTTGWSLAFAIPVCRARVSGSWMARCRCFWRATGCGAECCAGWLRRAQCSAVSGWAFRAIRG